MPFSLPLSAVPNAAEPFLVDFGGVLTPFGGGPSQRLNRLGLRLGGRFTLPPHIYGGDGMTIISRLVQAKTDRLILPWPQPGFEPGDEGVPKVKVAVSGGTTLQIKGLPAGKELFEGQFFSLVKDRRYLHFFTAPGTADSSGDVTASVWPPMRIAFAVNDVVEIADPKIEGHVLPGEELKWGLSVDRMVDIQFSVAEAK